MTGRAIAGAVLAAGLVITPSGQAPRAVSPVVRDVTLCRYFPEYRTELPRVESARPAWARAIPRTDPELARYARALDQWLTGHPHARNTRGRLGRVWLACNPDG